MGYMVHHALVITGDAREDHMPADRVTIEDAHAFAVEEAAKRATPCEVTPLTAQSVNGYRSFMVAPDGSKEGWCTSGNGDECRAAIVAWLRSSEGYFSFAEVRYGDEGGDNGLEAHDNDGVTALATGAAQ